MATSSDPKPLPLLTQGDIKRFWSKINKTSGQGPKDTCWNGRAHALKTMEHSKLEEECSRLIASPFSLRLDLIPLKAYYDINATILHVAILTV